MKTIPKSIPSGRTMRLGNTHGLAEGALNLAPLPAFDRGLGSGQMFGLSNEAMLTEETYSEPLTTYGVGFEDPENNKALVNYLAPNVQSARIFEVKRRNNAEEFLADSDDMRAIGGEFKMLRFSGSTEFLNTQNKGLGFRYDMDYVASKGVSKGTYAEDPERFQQRIVAMIMRRLWRNEAIRTVTLALAAATNTAVTWSSGTPKPLKDMRTALSAGQLAYGIFNNRALWALDSWQTQQDAFETANTPAGYRNADKTPQAIAEALLLDKGMVSKAVYQTGAAAKSRLLSAIVLFFHALDIEGDDDPSHFKRFWSPTDSGEIRVYVNQYGKFTDIFVELYSRIVAMNTAGVRKLTVS